MHVDGSVRVRQTSDGLAIARGGGNVVVDHVLDPEQWESVVEAMVETETDVVEPEPD